MQSEKRIALYIRLSMEDADIRDSPEKTESNSVRNQRRLLLDYYESHTELKDYEVIEFCDDGYSGTNFKRPRFMDMMELVRQREIHCIMVKDLSRFGREYLEVGAYLELILPLFGTRFISVNDAFDSKDYVGTTGGVELALRNLINGLYSKDLSVKVRSAIQTRNRRGQYWGGNAFYGYRLDPEDKHKLVVDKETSPVIQRIFERCTDGLSTAQIAQELNEEGIPSPAAYKKSLGQNYNGKVMEKEAIWIASTVRKILNDERYTGKMISGQRETAGIHTGKMRPLPKDQWIVVEGTHDAIVSQELFQEAGASLQRRLKTINSNTAGNRAENLFVCGYCGRKLQKAPGKSTHLFCMKTRSMPDCECSGIHEELDRIKGSTLRIVQILANLLIEKEIRETASADQTALDLEKEIKAAKKRLQSLQNGKLDLYEDYRMGRMTRERFAEIQMQRQEEADLLKDRIESASDRLEKIKKQSCHIEGLAETAREIRALSEYRPEVIRKLVDQVSVFADGRIEISLTSNDAFIADLPQMAVDMASSA